MNAIELLRAQYRQSFEWLQGSLIGVNDEVARYKPQGLALPIAGQLAHTITSVDMLVLGMVAGQQPLLSGAYAGKAGISEPPPQGAWGDWGADVEVDLEQIQAYAKAVFAAVDDYLATLTDADLDRKVPFGPMGEQPIAVILYIALLNTHSHTGEIACIKGLQGMQGYAF